jgi:hypothetical protein
MMKELLSRPTWNAAILAASGLEESAPMKVFHAKNLLMI